MLWLLLCCCWLFCGRVPRAVPSLAMPDLCLFLCMHMYNTLPSLRAACRGRVHRRANESLTRNCHSVSHTQFTNLWGPHHAAPYAHPPAKAEFATCLSQFRGTPACTTTQALKNERQEGCRQQRGLIDELSDVGRWKLCRCRLPACIRVLSVATCKPCAPPAAIGQAHA